eukprot:PhM_4_TR18298/c0_g1_i1/m.89774
MSILEAADQQQKQQSSSSNGGNTTTTTTSEMDKLTSLVSDFRDILTVADSKNSSTSKTTLTPRYLTESIIGRGAYGHALLISDITDSSKKFVGKIMDLTSMSEQDRCFALSEARCLARCCHPCIIRLYETHERGGKLLMVVEHADGGDLSHQIAARAQRNAPFEEREVLFIFLQLCLAVDYLHQQRMMHRDLKTANIFLTECGLVKLGDFGFSRQYNETLSEDVGNTFCGTPYYVAPELWERRPYSGRAEMWSLGVILYEILTLRRPFADSNMRHLVHTVLDGRYEPPQRGSPELLHVLNALLSRDPEHRPTVRDMVSGDDFMRMSMMSLRHSVAQIPSIPAAAREALVADVDMLLSGGVREAPVPCVVRSGVVRIHLPGVVNHTWDVRVLCITNDVGLRLDPSPSTVLPYDDITDVRGDVVSGEAADRMFHISMRAGCDVSSTIGTSVFVCAQSKEDCADWVHEIKQRLTH